VTFRADVAVPSGIAFLFGSALGLTAGWVIATGGQTEPDRGQSGRRAAPQQAAPQQDAASQEMQLRESLAMHEELLAGDSENPRLLKTVGEYHAALGGHDKALEFYARAETALRADPAFASEVPQLLFDQALSLAELDRYRESLAMLEEASEMEPQNVSPLLIQVYIYMRRIMPAPPPGFDRREALARAEVLLADILRIEPGHGEALQLQQAIASVRSSRSAPEGGSAGAP
jgi:tetratricopeptide (TPR) repeat protein